MFIHTLDAYSWGYFPRIYIMPYRSMQMQSNYMDQDTFSVKVEWTRNILKINSNSLTFCSLITTFALG